MMTETKPKPVISRKTVYAGLETGGEGILPELIREAIQGSVILVSSAVQSILEQLEDSMETEFDADNQLNYLDILIPCKARDLTRALENVGKERRKAPTDRGDKETARPQYKNSYHLEEMIDRGGSNYLRFRVAEAFFWLASRGEAKGKRLRDLNLIDAKKGLQQLIMSWLRPELDHLPAPCRAGACQQVAQQFLSHIGLINQKIQPKTAFPSLEIRDPSAMEEQRLMLLEKLARRTEPFEYKTARELRPSRYEEDDKRGDRLVNVDPEWLSFIGASEPSPLPLNFVKSDDVIIYRRVWQVNRQVKEVRRNHQVKGKKYLVQKNQVIQEKSHLYAALPLFEGVPPQSLLGKVSQNEELFWWRHHLDEFVALPAWPGKKLSARDLVMVVPLNYDPPHRGRPSRFESIVSGSTGYRVNWSLLVQKGRGQTTSWEIHLATSREVAPSRQAFLQSWKKVLGIHFGYDQLIYWAIADITGKIISEGSLSPTIMEEALRAKLKLEEMQNRLAWVGDRRFTQELKRRTYDVARSIVQLAAESNAGLAIEEIKWVDKHRGGPQANLRFSLWNYSGLAQAIESKGLDWSEPVPVVAWFSDYLLRFTCPNCGAIGKSKEEKGQALTLVHNGILTCRKCNFSGVVADKAQARLAARLGAKRLADRLVT